MDRAFSFKRRTILVALSLPPLLLGVIGKTKAVFAGRVRPPVFQPYYDLIKLFRKDSVFSTTSTWVFRAGPVVGLVTTGLAVLLVPLGNTGTVSTTEVGQVMGIPEATAKVYVYRGRQELYRLLEKEGGFKA